MSKIFVGRLAWKTTREILASYFGKYGQVTDARVVADRTTGRSKGFGFVTFADQAGADQAIRQQNHEIDGRAVIVNVANEPGPPPRIDFNQQQGGYGQNQGGYGQNQNQNRRSYPPSDPTQQ